MTPKTAAILAGAGCALIGPAVVRAFADNPTDEIFLSLIIAGSVVATTLILGLRSWED
jgi:F0F1-type ATP synthase membrane subunit c/vacuolar-type H+-ATPase subunit K